MLIIFTSCKKDWLDAKTNSSLVVPGNLDDFNALLNDDNNYIAPLSKSDIAAGEFYLSDESWKTLSISEQSIYNWEPNYSTTSIESDWAFAYKSILCANVVLDGLSKLTVESTDTLYYQKLKGSALFIRCWQFYHLAQQYCLPYSLSTAKNDMGIPLRSTTDITVKSPRSSLEETYSRIIDDLSMSISMLPNSPDYKTQPSKPAAYGLMSRIYLSMQRYEEAGIYADSALNIYSTLLDYNTLDISSSYPVPFLNDETVFFSQAAVTSASDRAIIPKEFYETYDENDLRKDVFYTIDDMNFVRYKGTYTANNTIFSGIASDELYLTRAETRARKGNITEALQDLNTVLRKRWKTGFFSPLNASTKEEAIAIILRERQKELIRRGLRWTDLKRLNKETAFAETLIRTVNGSTFTLPPNDKRYALPIPPDVVQMTGIEQNNY